MTRYVNMDTEVAEKVFGWKRGQRYGNGNGEWIFPEGTTPHFRKDWEGTPKFSSSLERAWMIIDYLKQPEHADLWDAFIYELNMEHDYAISKLLYYLTPAVICKAALAAVETVASSAQGETAT